MSTVQNVHGDGNLIVGWKVDRMFVQAYLRSINVGSCSDCTDNYQCFCGAPCWDLSKLPLGMTFVCCSPHRDSLEEEQAVFFTMDGVYLQREIQELQSQMAEIDWPAMRAIAVKLGAKDRPQRIWAEADCYG